MLYHILKQIFRNLWRYKSFTAINLLGLSLGIASLLLIVLITNYEKQFDSFHSDSQEVFRIVNKQNRGGEANYEANVPYPTAKFLRQEYPGITATQVHFAEEVQLRLGQHTPFKEENIVFADSLFFQVLDFALVPDYWVSGNAATALEGPGKAILTESSAKSYFGTENPIGKRIWLDNSIEVEVVAVVKDVPATSHLPFNMLVSYPSLTPEFFGGLDIDSWRFTGGGYAYVRLQKTADRAAAEAALQSIIERNATSEGDRQMKMTLQPLSEIHYDLTYESSNATYTVSPAYLRMLLLLGVFIIMIACVNYINLSTSLAFTKSKEVGIRKTIGASRIQLFFHYMLETFIVTCCAALLGLIITLMVLPSVNSILDKEITAAPLLEVPFLLGSVLVLQGITLISGAYPALILAGFNPVASLKNQMAMPGKASVVLRKGLVVFQFAVSTALIICTLVIARQMEYFQNKELGFTKEAVVEVPMPMADSVKREKFRSLLQNQTGIEQLSFALGAPISDTGLGVSMSAPQLDESISYEAKIIACDVAYKGTYGLKMLAGRWLLPAEEKDLGSAVVVNRQLAKTLGYNDPAEAIGNTIEIGINRMRPTIVGVTEDFHTSSLHEAIQPVALLPFPYFYGAAGIRLSTGNMKNTLAAIEKAWWQVYPDNVFEVKFIDETLAARYEQESKDYQLFKAFSLVSIFICCIGLWGLIAFVVVRKTKEIGIRKVLGASVSGIVVLISKDFLKLVVLALLIASPVAWFFMQQWLQDFAYRINISWWIFALAGMAALLIAFITISYQALKAALANPVKNLRTE